ncbi:MAG: Fe-S-containing protein [Thermodesulfovibrionales bacterium]
MSLFIPEAFTGAIKSSIAISASWLLVNSYLSSRQEETGPLHLFILILWFVLFFIGGTFIELDAFYKEQIRRASAYLFGLLLIAAFFSADWFLKREFKLFYIFLIMLLYAPDVMSLSFFLKDLSAMRQNFAGVYIAGIAGFLSGLSLLFFEKKIRSRLSPFLSFTGLLFSLSAIKLLLGGTGGYAELSLIPSVQRGLMKFFHDLVHQLFVFFMVPDHPLLKTTVWNFIGLAFGEAFTMIATLCILVIPPMVIVSRLLKRPEQVPDGLKGAERRRYIHEFMLLNRKRAVPIFLFVFLVSLLWFFKGESGPGLYIPQPIPVIEEGGFVIVKLKEPGRELGDGNIHKFILRKDDETYRFFVFRRPDGRFSVCLDACEICPPEGYGQAREHLICIYCNTPISFNTVGEPGGCNPIPVNFILMEKEIKIEVQEILKKWRLVHSGISRE